MTLGSNSWAELDTSIPLRIEQPNIAETLRKAEEAQARQNLMRAEQRRLNAEAALLEARDSPAFAAESSYLGEDGRKYILIIMDDGSVIKTDALAP